ncbi:hypothetical protein pEaSNUABM11_00025 [Erwinia phage pEa_SNUABM_11]|nr:hypothetical protein pEaSNUABM11_00025 [Erwinia phage pEa_SNUABM_11]
MIYAYDLMDIVKNFGTTKFYEHIREHICVIVEKSGLNFVESDEAITGVYQKYALAYAVATKARSLDVLIEILFEDSHDPVGDWLTVKEQTLLDMNALEAIENITNPKPVIAEDEFTLDVDSLQVFPNSYGDDDQQQLAFQAVCELFAHEMETQTGLYGLFEQLMPGTYNRYVGDDYFTAVVMCDAPLLESIGCVSI